MFSDAKKKFGLIILLLAVGFLVLPSQAEGAGEVVINEIAWMGIKENSYAEWIELYNNSNQEIDLSDYVISSTGGLNIVLQGVIPSKGYFLLLKNTTGKVPEAQPDQIYKGASLRNALGEKIIFKNQNGDILEEIDCSQEWFAGEASPDYKTMERKNPLADGNNPDNWGTSQRSGGTPKAQNSVFQSGEPTPAPTPTPTLTPISTPTPIPTLTPTPDLTPTPTPSSNLTPTPSLTPVPTPKPVYSRLVVINEFIPDPVGSDAEGEWIELFNEGNEPVDLGDWQLTSNNSKYTIPQNTIIGAKSYLVFYRSIIKKMSINNNGETLSFFDPNGDLAFKISYEGKAPEGQSLARQTNGQWLWTASPTPGSQNIIKAAEAKTAATKTPPVQDSEKAISPSPVSVNSPISTSLPAREETAAGAPAKSSNLVSSASSPKQGNSSQAQSEAGEDYFSGKNQAAAAVETGWLNYKITGLAILIGLFSVASILILKRFVV